MKSFNASILSLFPLFFITLLAVAVVGCQRMVSFNVIRPAKVNVRGIAGEGSDATVSLGRWDGVDGSAVADIEQRIREIVVGAPGGFIKLTEAEGVVRLDGVLSEYSYDERVTSKQAKCSRSKNGKTHTYSCTHHTREGLARIRVALNVYDRGGKLLAAKTFADESRQATFATDESPEPIDREMLLTGLRAAAARDLSKLVVPYYETVQKRWFKCGDANDTCEAARVQMQAGNFDVAKSLLERAIDQLRAAAKPDMKALGAAWWGLTLAHEFSGDYAAAMASVTEAIKAQPHQSIFATETSNIRREQASRNLLMRQLSE